MKITPFLLALATFLLVPTALPVRAAEELIPREQNNLSFRNEVQIALNRGLQWLKEQQKPAGYWSSPDHPAISALALTAYLRSPSGEYRESRPDFIDKGLDWLLRNAQPDGGIYVPEKGLSNYNTSISLMALASTGDPKFNPAILAGRDFVVGMQAKGLPAESLDGGMGYGPGGSSRQHPDMSNTLMALDALYQTRELPGRELPGGRQLNWEAVVGFIQRCQNLPASNPEPWASDDLENKGGFVYFPGHSMAGEMDLPNGKKALRSYGSMTYAGLLSYIYADIQKDDPRVQAALDWLKRHYTLEENPGMGSEGLFYYYHVMAKALATAGVGNLPTADAKDADWRKELALKLINLQTGNGSWMNETGRWMEKDPVLVTAYSVLTLEILYRAL